jgi:Fur family peroxide stress response transcriptional regulator
MRMATADLERALRERGLRVTAPRMSVLAYLAATESHPTAEEVEEAVNREGQVLSRASVYNVLHSLSEAGLVSELVVGQTLTRYDANLGPHHHLLCRGCGRLEDVPWDHFSMPDRGELPDGRAVDALALTLHGLCRACSAASAGSGGGVKARDRGPEAATG